MNRSAFVKTCLAATGFVTAPFAAVARYYKERVDKGFMVKAGKDRFDKPISLFEGDTFNTKVSTKDSDGDVCVFETTRVKEGGPSFHLHYNQDEFWYIIKGEFLFKVGEETFTAKAGDTVFGPRNVPHAFSKVGEGEAKILMFFQPAGKMEEMFQKISEGITKNMSEEEMDKFRHEHGIKKVGPALTHFKKW
ncbi:MAG: cupin domain-containing protein [Sediminibacterium sp.]|jgi:mannose-6-phosphate isomerase-like protein (cupin superfamily)|nr:cupin domain-containing protein [Chitinophagaceae bacterium]MCA6446623.1 cupin domain-containing protein [Chitinophagaceae bacterium]